MPPHLWLIYVRADSVLPFTPTGAIPAAWQQYKTEKGASIQGFIVDFVDRIAQLDRLSKSSAAGPAAVWLGGLFRPSGWITASRQEAAHQQGVSLEALHLELDIANSSADEVGNGYRVEGVSAQVLTRLSGAMS